jgi:hypothetical protein
MRIRCVADNFRQNPRFKRLTTELHRLGPRPVGEALLLVARGRDLFEVLEEYSQLDPALIAKLEARDWPPLPIARVA